jgi:hypothetical protein
MINIFDMYYIIGYNENKLKKGGWEWGNKKGSISCV